MKKFTYLIIIFCLMSYCGPKQDEIERTHEDGVEVVLNHIDPCTVKGEPSELVLEEELKVDFEDNKFADFGIREPDYVDTDSEGNIYVVDRRRPADHFIMKFDKEGNFIKNIGRKGQGPGEIQGIAFISINQKDEIMISDGGNKKILTLDKEGNLVDEKKYDFQWLSAIILENGYYLAGSLKMKGESRRLNLALYSSDFTLINDLDFFQLPHQTPKGKNPYTIGTFYWRVRNGKIFVGNEQRGYEILVYDFDGNLLQKIRKEYNRVKYPDKFKKETEEIAKNNPEVGPWDYCPPFNSFFIDDDDRLFVMTYEQDENEEEYIYDIFNESGILTGRKSIGLTYAVTRSLLPRRAIAKNSRYYRLRYKDSGYVELIVYKMLWQ